VIWRGSSATIRVPGHLQGAVEGLGSVGEATQPRARPGVGAADPVVAHLDAPRPGNVTNADSRDAGVRVPRDGRERLGHDVVGGGFDGQRRPLAVAELDLDVDRHSTTNRACPPNRRGSTPSRV
jgi:hypothetical protein